MKCVDMIDFTFSPVQSKISKKRIASPDSVDQKSNPGQNLLTVSIQNIFDHANDQEFPRNILQQKINPVLIEMIKGIDSLWQSQ